MKNCILCSVDLRFGNTPLFGSGKLKDGGVICTNCFKKINKNNQSIALKLKKYSLEEIEAILDEMELNSSKNSERLKEIKTEIQNLELDNISTFFGKKEINELPNIIAENEHIENIIQGTYNDGQGILVLTNSRLIFIDKGVIYGLKVEDFPLNKISSIKYETGLIMGKIKIHTTSNVASIENVENNSARRFAESVREKLSGPTEDLKNNEPKADIIDQIEKLARLKENGILSEDEFTEQKKKLLDKL